MLNPREEKESMLWYIAIAKEVLGEREILARKKLYNPEGMCFGCSCLAAQALVNRNFQSFNDRFQWLRSGPPKIKALSEQKQILPEEKRSDLVKIVTALFETPEFSDLYKDKEFKIKENEAKRAIETIYFGMSESQTEMTPKELKYLIQIAQGIRAHFAKQFSRNPEALQQFDKENPNICNLIDCKIFLENMAIYQAVDLLTELHPPGTILKIADPTVLFPIIAPVELETKSRDAPTRLKRVADFEGLYPLENLKTYFQVLEEMIKKYLSSLEIRKGGEKETKQESEELPFSILLGSIGHQICVGYNRKTGKWILVNPSHLPPEEFDNAQIADRVAFAFTCRENPTPPKLTLQTQIIIDEQVIGLKDTIEEWINDTRFKKIHDIPEITSEKPESVDDIRKTSLLLMAARNNRTALITELLKQKADPFLKDFCGATPATYSVQGSEFSSFCLQKIEELHAKLLQKSSGTARAAALEILTRSVDLFKLLKLPGPAFDKIDKIRSIDSLVQRLSQKEADLEPPTFN